MMNPEELTNQEKLILVKILDQAVEAGLIQVTGGVEGALQSYQILNNIKAKLMPTFPGKHPDLIRALGGANNKAPTPEVVQEDGE